MKYLLSALAISLGSTIYAQSNSANQVDPRIAEVYGNSLSQILAHDNQRLTVLNQLLKERIQIVDQDSASAKEKFPALYAQPIFNKYVPSLTVDAAYNAASFNPLKYDLDFFQWGDRGYWINGTNKVLFIQGFKNYNANNQ
jgi:hypothetical protein